MFFIGGSVIKVSLVFIIFIAMNLSSSWAIDPAEFDPVKTFSMDPEVMKKWHLIKRNAQVVVQKPSANLLYGSCGIVGCEYKYLVTMGFSSSGANPQIEILGAFVLFKTYQKAQVKLLSRSQVRLLQQDKWDQLVKGDKCD